MGIEIQNELLEQGFSINWIALLFALFIFLKLFLNTKELNIYDKEDYMYFPTLIAVLAVPSFYAIVSYLFINYLMRNV